MSVEGRDCGNQEAMNRKILCLIITLSLSLVCARLPDSLKGKKCPRRGSKVESCILKAIENGRPLLKKGVREANIPRLEPFKLRTLDLDAEVPLMMIKGEASNIVAKGAGDFIIKKFKINIDKTETDITLMIPHLSVTADYDTVGSRISTFDVDGSGQFKGDFYDVVATILTKGYTKKIKGLEYAKIDTVDIKVDTGRNPKVTIIPDEKGKTATLAGKFIENNIETILDSMGAFISKAATPIIMSNVNRILNVIPLDDVFEK